MAYRIEVDTSKYKNRKCSEKNWEPGTMNDYMHAINGWKHRETSLKHLLWLLTAIQTNGKDYHLYGVDEDYTNWWNGVEKKLTIKYKDVLCGFERSQYLGPYGFAQGYFSVGGVVEKVRQEGYAEIKFSYFYDSRQYLKNMDGCSIKITKV